MFCAEARAAVMEAAGLAGVAEARRTDGPLPLSWRPPGHPQAPKRPNTSPPTLRRGFPTPTRTGRWGASTPGRAAATTACTAEGRGEGWGARFPIPPPAFPNPPPPPAPSTFPPQPCRPASGGHARVLRAPAPSRPSPPPGTGCRRPHATAGSACIGQAEWGGWSGRGGWVARTWWLEGWHADPNGPHTLQPFSLSPPG